MEKIQHICRIWWPVTHLEITVSNWTQIRNIKITRG